MAGVVTMQDGDEAVPRWEWRTFATSLKVIEDKMTSIGEAVPRTSSEVYFLRLGGPQNVKVRDEILDIKRLREVGANGLELWEPVFKAAFPLSRSEVATVFTEWQLPLPRLGRESYTMDQFVSELVASQRAIRVAHVAKSRRSSAFAGCIAEFVRLSVDLLRLESFSIEHEQPVCILAALCQLGLEAVANTNYPLALKRALGFVDSDHNPEQTGAAHVERD